MIRLATNGVGRELGWWTGGLCISAWLGAKDRINSTWFLCLISARLELCYLSRLNLEPTSNVIRSISKGFDYMWDVRSITSCYFLMRYDGGYKQVYIPLNVTVSIPELEGYIRVRSGEDGVAHLSHMLNKSYLRSLFGISLNAKHIGDMDMSPYSVVNLTMNCCSQLWDEEWISTLIFRVRLTTISSQLAREAG